MASLNRATLIGRLGKDPEIKTTGNGKQVCKFSIATDDGFGENKSTTWHNIVVWEKTAEACAKYLTKGSNVCVEGRIVNRSYDDKDGVKKYVSEVVATNVTFLDSKKSAAGEASQKAFPVANNADDSDGVPF